MFWILLGYITVISILAFAMMGIDKKQARNRGRRISERNLWSAAFFGGAIGAYIGMMKFRHKTQHTNFRVGFLMLAIGYAALIVWAYMEFGFE